MKNYVVGVLSFFENDLKLFKVTAENEYEACKLGIVDFTREEYKEDERAWQQNADYPQNLEQLLNTYYSGDIAINIIEV